MELELQRPLTAKLSLKVSPDIESRLDHHCARLASNSPLTRAALIRALLRKGLKELDETESDNAAKVDRKAVNTNRNPSKN